MKVDWDKTTKTGLSVLKPFLSVWLEERYDELFRTKYGDRMREWEQKSRGVLSKAMGVAFGVVDGLDADGHKFQQFLKDIGSDSVARVMKRIKEDPEAIARADKGEMLLALDKQSLQDILDWAQTVDPEQRKKFLRIMDGLTAEEIKKLMELEPEQQQAFFRMVGPQGRAKAQVSKEESGAESKSMDATGEPPDSEEQRIESIKATFFDSFHESAERASQTLRDMIEDKRRKRQTLRELRAEKKRKSKGDE